VSVTYTKCRKCGFIDESVCVIFFGHVCEQCDAVDAAVLRRGRKEGGGGDKTPVPLVAVTNQPRENNSP
jgi:hypothetical protein